jgi:hypothetical protein
MARAWPRDVMLAKASKSRWSAVGFMRRPYHEIASDRLSDNPNEALKGRQVSSESFALGELAVIPEALPDADALPDAGTGPFDPQPPAGSALATVTYDEAHVYERALAYDHANRPTAVMLPRDPDFDSGVLGAGGPVVSQYSSGVF